MLGIEPVSKGSGTGNEWIASTGEKIDSYSPVNGKLIGSVISADKKSYEAVIKKAEEAFKVWRTIPAPKRGDIVRQVGDQFRQFKEPLGKLVSYEMGKSLQEEPQC